jgi:hypothetical protein
MFHTDHARELSLDRGEAKYWDTGMDVNDPGYTFKDVDQADKWGDILSDSKGFLDQYLGKSSKYRDEAESPFNTQQKAEDVAKGTAAGWGTHELGSNFTALTPPVMGTGQDQPFVLGGAGGQAGQAGGGTVSRMAGGAMTGAQIGSIVPGIGTGIGAAIGAGLGAFGIL